MAGGRHGRGRGLSRELVLDAAIDLVEREGSPALTMRRLGASLGVEAMSLYRYVSDRDDLLDGMAERLLGSLAFGFEHAGWEDACEAFARELRVLAIGSPQTFALTALRPLRGPVALRPVEQLLGALVRDGVAPDRALMTYRSVASFARGYALAEVAGFTVDASTETGRRALEGLDDERFPVLGSAGRDLRSVTADRAFDTGLRSLIDGLSASGPGPRAR